MIDAILLALTAAVAIGPDTAPPPPAIAPTTADQRYCVVTNLTGTLIAKRECHTRAEWLKRGFDPLDPK